MNRYVTFYESEQELDYEVESRRLRKPVSERRRTEHVRRSRPTGFNGIHRRRNKRWTW